jgi:hypothetical protein
MPKSTSKTFSHDQRSRGAIKPANHFCRKSGLSAAAADVAMGQNDTVQMNFICKSADPNCFGVF